jgi:hypothetical protein
MAPLRFTRSHKVHDLHGLALTRFILRKKENFSPARSGWSSPSLSASISSGEYLSLREPKQLPIYVSMPSESEESDSSYVDIEPTTGKTMRLRIRLEISTSTNHTDFDVFYPHLYKVFCALCNF